MPKWRRRAAAIAAAPGLTWDETRTRIEKRISRTRNDRVRFAPEVPDELAEAVLWYEARRQGLGSEFLDEVQATLPLIGVRPRSFPRLQDVDATLEIRRALLARFPDTISRALAQRASHRRDGPLATPGDLL